MILKSIFVGVVFLGVGGIIIRQRHVSDELRAELGRWQDQRRERERQAATARAELQRRKAALDRGRAAQEEAERLRREIAELRRTLASVSASAPAVVPAGATSPAAERKPKQWTNAGNATPVATVETVLWSARGGDTDLLASLIAFEPAGRANVDALFARLPESQRATSGSPEKVFATLMAARLPNAFSGLTVATTTDTGDSAVARVRIERLDGTEKEANLNFHRTPAGWRLVVPDSVVENYQQMLAGAPPESK